MLKKSIIALAILFVGISSAFSQPKLEIVGGNEYNWGKVKASDSPLKTKIKIKNTGNQLLKIHSVKPSCGCTTAPLDKDQIKPGEFATLDITLNAPKDAGSFTKPVTITSNDPQNDKIDLVLKGNLVLPLKVFPKFLNMGYVEPNKQALAKIVLSNNIDSKIKILKVSSDLDGLKINLKDGMFLAPKSDFTIEATYSGKQVGKISGNITIKTDNKDQETFTFQVFANVIGS